MDELDKQTLWTAKVSCVTSYNPVSTNSRASPNRHMSGGNGITTTTVLQCSSCFTNVVLLEKVTSNSKKSHQDSYAPSSWPLKMWLNKPSRTARTWLWLQRLRALRPTRNIHALCIAYMPLAKLNQHDMNTFMILCWYISLSVNEVMQLLPTFKNIPKTTNSKVSRKPRGNDP